MKIYTKTGDKGRSTSVDGRRRPKSDMIFAVEGQIDELNSYIGLVLAVGKDLDAHNRAFLQNLQHQLFNIGAHFWKAAGSEEITGAMITALEQEIDRLSDDLPPLENFILPGGNITSAQIHIARAECRKLERLMVRFHEQEPVDILCLQYINRLSDYFFTLARYCNNKGQGDILWNKDFQQPK
ncbi:MAG: cob(I)yrinic acid a,c-diamide adenosyltransferase [Alphaproteobacteria bacterium]